MRHFATTVFRNSIFKIDFLSFENMATDDAARLSRATQTLLLTMGIEKFQESNASQQNVYVRFLDWYRVWEIAGRCVRVSQSHSRIPPNETAWSYFDLTTGEGITFIGYFNDGYGEARGIPPDIMLGY